MKDLQITERFPVLQEWNWKRYRVDVHQLCTPYHLMESTVVLYRLFSHVIVKLHPLGLENCYFSLFFFFFLFFWESLFYSFKFTLVTLILYMLILESVKNKMLSNEVEERRAFDIYIYIYIYIREMLCPQHFYNKS